MTKDRSKVIGVAIALAVMVVLCALFFANSIDAKSPSASERNAHTVKVAFTTHMGTNRHYGAFMNGHTGLHGTAYYTGSDDTAYANYANNDFWGHSRHVMLLSKTWLAVGRINKPQRLNPQNHWATMNYP